NSSTATSRSAAGSNEGSARSDASAAPLRFMYVVGLRTRTGMPSTLPSLTRARSPRRKAGNPQRATSASASQNPTLCRVAAYAGPGLPRPTTARRDQLSLPPLGFSAFSDFSPFSPLAAAAPPPAFGSGLAPPPPPPPPAPPPPSAAAAPSSSSPSRTFRMSSG